jgi:hypothetical protein
VFRFARRCRGFDSETLPKWSRFKVPAMPPLRYLGSHAVGVIASQYPLTGLLTVAPMPADPRLTAAKWKELRLSCRHPAASAGHVMLTGALSRSYVRGGSAIGVGGPVLAGSVWAQMPVRPASCRSPVGACPLPRWLHQQRFAGRAAPTLVGAEFEAKMCGSDIQQPHFSAAVSAHGSFITLKLLNDCTSFGHAPLT